MACGKANPRASTVEEGERRRKEEEEKGAEEVGRAARGREAFSCQNEAKCCAY